MSEFLVLYLYFYYAHRHRYKTKKQTTFSSRLLCILSKCGEGGIRTPGASQLNGFQDRRNRPLCHLSKGQKYGKDSKPPNKFRNIFINFLACGGKYLRIRVLHN